MSERITRNEMNRLREDAQAWSAISDADVLRVAHRFPAPEPEPQTLRRARELGFL